MGLYVLSSFAQLNKIKDETPEFVEYARFVTTRLQNTIRKQLYLQNHGVSFDYTDKQSYQQIEDLIQVCKDEDEELERLKG